MTIDLDNRENLLIKSNRRTFTEGLDYFSKIISENPNNVFYNLTRTTSLKDIDIKFIIAFLSKTNYIDFKEGRINKKLNINPNLLIDELVFFYYTTLLADKTLNESLFIKSEFKVINDEISINLFSVDVRYRIFFSILQNLELLTKSDEKGIVVVKNFTLAKKFLERPLRKISPKELEKELEQQRLNGIEAEKFVLAYETSRLGDMKIDWVAEYIANEGYDILSFDNASDEEYNRFIEVKSYQGDSPYFYWSRNEFLVAKYKQDSYWIYLVNRDLINDKNYEPTMIQNPHETILNNGIWSKEIDKYRIELKIT